MSSIRSRSSGRCRERVASIERGEPFAPLCKRRPDLLRIPEIRKIHSPHTPGSRSDFSDVPRNGYRRDVGPARVESAKWPGANVDPLCGNPDRTSPLNPGAYAIVKHAERQRDDPCEDCRTRQVMGQVPPFRSLGKQNARGPDVDPINTVRGAMRRWSPSPKFTEAAREREYEHGAGSDFDRGKPQGHTMRAFSESLRAGSEQTRSRNGVIDLLKQLRAFEPSRLQRDHD